MRHTEIAIAKPFEGKPKINVADLFGVSPNKPMIFKVPVTGERPVEIRVEGLPEGLECKNGIITGKIKEKGNYDIIVIAENKLGKDKKKITIEAEDNAVLLTPLLGFTSWNAFGSEVSQKKMVSMAHRISELGISEYGYSYINTDSGWQKEYGGKYDAIMPNDKFPDMKKMCDEIHSLGFKCGIYSTPMLMAWGCPKEFESIPGCTVGEKDDRFSDVNGGGVGLIRKEKNNALQWAEWGIDYLKYDWAPSDPYNADIMRNELIKTDRDFGFCVTVFAAPENINYWKKYCNSYRYNSDAIGNWENLLSIYYSQERFMEHLNKGHFFDLDMLDVGTAGNEEANIGKFTEDEQLVAYSLRAFFSSPIQISSTLENIDDFELSMYCNEEIIAINQDVGFNSAKLIMQLEKDKKIIHVYKKKLYDGNYALAVFNLGETEENVKVFLDEATWVRDVWKKEDVGVMPVIDISTYPHTVRIFKVIKNK